MVASHIIVSLNYPLIYAHVYTYM